MTSTDGSSSNVGMSGRKEADIKLKKNMIKIKGAGGKRVHTHRKYGVR